MISWNNHSVKSYKSILDDITCDQCDKKYCILKELLLNVAHPDGRTTIQIKCIDKFKYEQSELNGSDIGWEEALNRWVDYGYAEAYAIAYNEDLSFLKIYRLTMKLVADKK